MPLDRAFNAGFTLFLSLIVEALPFLLMGVLFSSALMLFINEGRLISLLPRNPVLGALAGSVMGFLFPVCECGNVPVARRLLMQGIPTPVAVGFLLAAPTANPVAIWATWTAFRDRPEIVVLRVLAALAIAMIVACVFAAQKDLRPFLNPSLARSMLRTRELTGIERMAQERGLLTSGTYWPGVSQGRPLETSLATMQSLIVDRSRETLPAADRWRLFIDNVVRELRELGGVLVIGSAIAAVVQVAVPREVVLGLGQGPVSSIITMMTLAAVISICSTVDSFFALSFSGAFTTGSVLSFLVFGPIIDLKAIGLLLSIFQPRAVLYMFLLAAQLAFLVGLAINFQTGW
jgi:uncharacterized membrane protein YraQ (UPF0718 family)